MRVIVRTVTVLTAAGFACAVYLYLSLPDVRVLKGTNPGTTAFMALREQEATRRGEPVHRDQRWVKYSRISQHLKRAVLVTEDSGFWQHEGVEFDSMRDAMETNLERGEFARGASTLTQQLAKNLYLSPSKNPIRKLRELWIARRLEAELSKQRIFELYLNVIEWGDGIWGAEAAARTYFHKAAADLSPQESALLAAAIANPHVLDPARPSARLRRRQQMIMRRMGAVTPPPVLAEPPLLPMETLPLVPEGDPASPSGTPPALPGTPLPPEKKPGGGGGPGR